ncbi:DUF2272 domain-containing protein [Aquincola sp. MAHUQ-54]|uniref:DUF2272 domain-containing protein n=1 Tax=Aquincola agrisoli TaxID=3119538 RepID=A0AAW9QB50_9BURK
MGRLAIVCGVLLGLAGCAGTLPVAPTTVPAGQVEALVRAAEAEWLRWGRQEVRFVPGGGTCAVIADGSCRPIDDGCGREQSAALCPVVDDYWRALGPLREYHDCRRTDVCEAEWPADQGPPDFTPAWSAAFVSALMKAAGFSRSEFRFAAAHAQYVAAARDGHASAFEVVPTPAAADVGDLVCLPRAMAGDSGRPLGVDEVRGRDGITPMHCDIVVRRDLEARTLDVIGGNVQQAVSRSIVPLGADGLLHRWPEPERAWMLVMKPRRAPAPLP